MYYTNNSRELYQLLIDNGYTPIGEGYSKTYKYVLVLPSKEINQVEYFKNSVDWYIKENFSEYRYIKPEEYINYKGLKMSIVYCKCGKVADGNDWLCKTHYALEHFKRGDKVIPKSNRDAEPLEIISIQYECELYPYFRVFSNEKAMSYIIPFDKVNEIELVPRIKEIDKHIEFVDKMTKLAEANGSINEKSYQELLIFLKGIKK